jgi:hypothetical protein
MIKEYCDFCKKEVTEERVLKVQGTQWNDKTLSFKMVGWNMGRVDTSIRVCWECVYTVLDGKFEGSTNDHVQC